MQPIPEHIDELIARFLAKEATADDIVALNQWKQADEYNLIYFRQLEIIYNESIQYDSANYNVDLAWSNVKNQIHREEIKSVKKVKSFKPAYSQVLRIAAVLLLIAGIGWWINSLKSSTQFASINSIDKVLTDTLSDGSIFTLNKKSTIQYANGFGKKTRRLKLRGEAYFKVQHKDELPFVIEANGLLIEDIGTSFNVNAPDDSSFVEVIVEEGEVHFYREGSDGVFLTKGQGAIFTKSTGKIVKFEIKDSNTTAYRSGILDFNTTRLIDVAIAIERLYGIKITVDKEIQNCFLTVRFNNENLETILNVISETMNVRTIRSNDLIEFKGTNCTE